MTASSPGVGDQAVRTHSGRQLDGLDAIVNALLVGAAIAAGETTGPQHARDLQATLGDQVDATVLTAIGEFVPPDAQILNSQAGIVF